MKNITKWFHVPFTRNRLGLYVSFLRVCSYEAHVIGFKFSFERGEDGDKCVSLCFDSWLWFRKLSLHLVLDLL